MYQMTLERNNTQEFRSIEECIEVMKNNGYKCRCIVFCENDIIYEQKIVINNEGKVSVRPKKEVVKVWNNSFKAVLYGRMEELWNLQSIIMYQI